MKKKVLLILGLVLAFGLGYFYFYPHGLQTFRMKQIHDILYDVYFPNDPVLTTTQRAKRWVYKNLMWAKVKGNQQVEQILEPLVEFKAELPAKLKEEFRDVFQKGVNNVPIERVEELRRELMRQAPLDVQKKILVARQAWLYMIYSTPLADELAELNPAPAIEGVNTELNLPASRLFLQGDEIRHRDGEIDYLVIGSGPAGSVIAHELTRFKKARVVLIESGPFINPLCRSTLEDSSLMESNNLRRTISEGIMLRNGHAVGGGTTVNLDLAFSPLLPQIQKKLQSWMDGGHVPPDFFHDHNQDWGKLERAYNWVQERVHTRHVDLSEVNKNNNLLLTGTPLAKTYDLNERPNHGRNEILKISSAEAFVLPALLGKADFKGELSLISEAVVSRVELEDSGKLKTATSVLLSFSPRYRDKCAIADSAHLNPKSERTYRVKAKTIVLSAGTLGSAEVLLRSELANDKIGSGITIHPSMGAIGTFDRKINGLEGLSASVYAPAPDGSYFYEAMSATPNFIAALHPGNGHEILETVRHFNELGGFGVMLVDSVSEDNRVFLNPDTKKVEVAYQLSAEDKGKLKIGLSEAIRILLRQGAKSVFLPSSEMVDAQGRYSPIKTVNDVEPMMQNIQLNDGFNVMSSAHMQGSNKLSKDARSGVVSPHFRVWDTKYNAEIPNVYVCDSSVFPTSVGANPMQAIYSIAKLFVDQLLSP